MNVKTIKFSISQKTKFGQVTPEKTRESTPSSAFKEFPTKKSSISEFISELCVLARESPEY